MEFLEITELLGGILLFAFFITQIIIPIWNNNKLFPYFRKKKIEQQFVDVHDEIETAKAKKKLKKLKKDAETLKGE